MTSLINLNTKPLVICDNFAEAERATAYGELYYGALVQNPVVTEIQERLVALSAQTAVVDAWMAYTLAANLPPIQLAVDDFANEEFKDLLKLWLSLFVGMSGMDEPSFYAPDAKRGWHIDQKSAAVLSALPGTEYRTDAQTGLPLALRYHVEEKLLPPGGVENVPPHSAFWIAQKDGGIVHRTPQGASSSRLMLAQQTYTLAALYA